MNESINNLAAVSAANTLISANSIIKLASDIGNIYSMLEAAVYTSDLYATIKVIKSDVDKIAYDAELLSMHAMELSSLAAESIETSKKAETLLLDIEALIEKLTRIVDKLITFESLIVRKKAINPLIADELVTLVHTAASDGRNAQGLIEVALRSTNALVTAGQNN